MLLFHVLPGIKLADSFLPNNGCFDEFLVLPGDAPHNEIFSFPFVEAGGPYGPCLIDFLQMFTVSVV